jgi:hypothetical protein
MCRQPHSYAVDYFALGVLAFEFMMGRVTNNCLTLRGLIMDEAGRKLGIRSSQNESKLKNRIFPKAGL